MANTSKSQVQEYSSMDDQALADKITEEEVRLKKLKFSHAVNPIENPLVIRQLRRSIARMKTIQNSRTSSSK
ncbi:MAG: 50S ribosomal protein L29 [Flavipsychrobacter sp.]